MLAEAQLSWASPQGQILHSCTKWVTKGCDPCDRLRKQQTKSVAASCMSAGLFISKRRSCSFRKHQNMAPLLLQSSLSQFPWFSPWQWKLFPPATMVLELPGEGDGAVQHKFCSRGCVQCLCSNQQRPDFKLKGTPGDISKRLLAAMQGDQGLSGVTIPARWVSRQVL